MGNFTLPPRALGIVTHETSIETTDKELDDFTSLSLGT